MSSKMRKKSHKSKLGKKELDEKMKRRSQAHVDEFKVYKEAQDLQSPSVKNIDKESPSTINEELMDEMLLDNNK